jgi:hypothetical protein
MLSMLHKLGPALNQVNNELRKISPILPHVTDELRQIGPILPQLMAQIRKSARQQQRVEVALLDLRSELQHLKSYRRCEADHSVFCTERVEACSCTSPPKDA